MWDLSGRTTAFIISHLYVLRQSTGAIRADRHQRLDIDQALIVPCTICAGQQWSTCEVGACVQPGLSSDLWELHGQRVHFASSRLLVALHAATKPRQPANRSGEISSRMWSHCWWLSARRLGRTDVDVVALNLCSSTRHGAALRMPRGVRAAGMRPAATVLTIMAMQHFQARDVKLAKPVPILGLFLLNCDWRDSHACNTFPFTSSNQVTMPQVMQAILLLSHLPEGMQSQQLTHTSLNTPLPPTSQSPKHSLRHCKSQLPPVVLNTRLCGIKHMRHIGPETFTELCSFANRYAQPCSSQASSAYRPSVFAPHPLAFLAIFTNSRLRCLSSHKTHKLPALPMVSAPFFP